MNRMSAKLTCCLGDGLHAEYDGFQFRLYTEREIGGGQHIHEVYLDRHVLQAFLALVERAEREFAEAEQARNKEHAHESR